MQTMILNNLTLTELVNDTDIYFLDNKWEAILQELKQLEQVTAITYNNGAYHLTKGHYSNVEIFEHGIGQALNDIIDMRLFLNHWKYGLIQIKKNITLYFFDKQGNQVHTILIDKQTELALLLIDKYKVVDQSIITLDPYPSIEEIEDVEIDLISFHKDWQALKDTHDFFTMLRKHKVTRLQALRLGATEYVKEITIDNLISTLEKVKQEQIPLMSFVGNKGAIQIYTNVIGELATTDYTIQLSDSVFNLALIRAQIKHIYIVRKPTTDGIVSAIEVFNDNGDIITQFFGERKRDTLELKIWSDILNSI
ncbi:putative hemin transport protein [Myroides marinus]|uniref:Putative hemin transport protein n=1 Tax=Myroides marinus TaxID=703342 RepID=A0A1H6U6M6_9FLAO|nr:ChuX/HutX family heme-like substrate-binding protein [Myroides marinus]SEI87999.1 putative hemin transport protein [Myroides marinus]